MNLPVENVVPMAEDSLLVAKDIFLNKLGTYGDYEDARSEEMHDSIDLATEFIRILKISSEAEMQDGDWR